MWWHMTVIPVLRRLRQEHGQKFEANIGLYCEFKAYIIKPCLKKQTKTKAKKTKQNKIARARLKLAILWSEPPRVQELQTCTTVTSTFGF